MRNQYDDPMIRSRRPHNYEEEFRGELKSPPQIFADLQTLVDMGKASNYEAVALQTLELMRHDNITLEVRNDALEHQAEHASRKIKSATHDIKSMRALITQYKRVLNSVVGAINKIWGDRKYRSDMPSGLGENSALYDAATAILEKTEEWECEQKSNSRHDIFG